ncbi:DSC E3 ubiquitin ligase complex subunit 3 [Penicillium rolfsii]|nr:DSC E3 ubiquitin ligase complex subunit 3 [Penicillium rolfsii]
MASPSFLSPNTAKDPFVDALLITVRFSASIPDLHLDVPDAETTTGAGLKQLIRAQLPSSLASHRLRLIYAGRGLEDTTALATSLKLPPSPSRSPRPSVDDDDEDELSAAENRSAKTKAKGKQPVRDSRPRLYIHCSIGDIALSEADLAAEASVASTVLLQRKKDGSRSTSLLAPSNAHTSGSQSQQEPQQANSTTPAPRGFDRLLSAGFTAAEVTALRSQFLAVQSVSRTPDTMPTGEELRDLEDRWMDEGSTVAQAQGGGNASALGDDDGGFVLGSNSRGAMDDMLWGAVMGFFWPIGCAMWLRREEGVWSWRKGYSVFVGVLISVLFGTVRMLM